MFELIIGNNLNRDKVVTDLSCTLREALENADIDYTIGVIHLDGATIAPGDLDKTFRDFGITTKASLISVVKADAA